MCFYIGIEDLAANAMIEMLKKGGRRFLTYNEIEMYGAEVVQILKENGEKAVLILSRENTDALFRNYSEFFERRIRRHPVWKSEAEYKAFVLDMASGGSLLEKFEQAMSVTAKYLIKSTDSWVIHGFLIAKLEKEKDILNTTDMDPETKRVQLENKEMILKVVHSLEGYAKEKGISCNFVILMASQFNSGFGKPDFSATNIAFRTKDGEKVAAVGKIVSAIEAKERDRDNFFYLFYKRKDNANLDNDDIDNQEICKKLFKDVVF